MSLQKYTVQEAQNAGLGQAGYKVLQTGENTGAVTAGVEYVAISILEGAASTIATTSNDTASFPNLSDQIPEGSTIFGRWNNIALTGTSAVAICYRG